jgi:hypothetical protein
MNDVAEIITPRRAAQKRLVKRIGMGASALSVLLVLGVFALIVRTESAHDEASCPFSAGGAQTLGDASVREERRVCMAGVEERRYVLTRAGKSYELGRKRYPASRFADFRWALRDDRDGLVLELFVEGKLESEFHDADAVKP